MVTPRGRAATTGPAWIGSRSPAVVGAPLQRGARSLSSLLKCSGLSSLLCSLVTTPLSFPASNWAMSSSFSALAATAAI